MTTANKLVTSDKASKSLIQLIDFLVLRRFSSVQSSRQSLESKEAELGLSWDLSAYGCDIYSAGVPRPNYGAEG